MDFSISTLTRPAATIAVSICALVFSGPAVAQGGRRDVQISVGRSAQSTPAVFVPKHPRTHSISVIRWTIPTSKR